MIDPQIALGVTTPKFDNPLDLYGKALGIAGQQQQRQLGAQQLQEGALSIQKQQRAVQDQQITGKAFVDSGGDIDKAIQLSIAGGASPEAIMGLQQHKATIEKTAAETNKDQLPILQDKHERAAGLIQQAIANPNPQDQPGYIAQYQKLFPEDHGIQPGQTYTPEQLQVVLAGHMTLANAFAAQKAKEDAASAARAAAKAPAELTSAQNAAAASQFAPAEAAARAKTAQLTAAGQQPIQPAEQARIDAEAQARSETARHNLSAESTAKLQAAVAQGRLKQEQMVNGLKYGPDTVEFWAKQLQDNPDSVKELPPELKTKVGQQFRAATGLPLPTALSGPVQQSETAARNALDNIDFIRNALKNPEIQKNIGPIMGRLGNAEQAIGTAAGLSPEASQLAQELRTRMRYFVFQEGKAILGGRLPPQLMGQLESSSANVKMDPNMLEGALKGAEGSAGSVIDNADRQRFGGAMRPKEMRRGAAPAAATPTPEIKDQASYDSLPKGAHYTFNGQEHVKQ